MTHKPETTNPINNPPQTGSNVLSAAIDIEKESNEN